MKKFILSIIGIFLVALTPLAFADGDHENLPSIKEVIETLKEKQSVSSTKELQVSEISEDNLELLGDTVMEEMAGSSKHHEWMDKMHGGEGSEELKKFHISLGKNYLEDGESYSSMRSMGDHMMGWKRSSKSSNKSWSHSMHGGYGLSVWHGLMFIGHIILWILVVGVTVFVARKVWDMSGPKKKK
ncbi:hypothetical protein HON22_05130 [Candidatus Peregrinibacteria bacterium]|jgi:hypothetical protein|nr:hypothetical protein [Candidatus Peregrinibacteria bacterium]